MIRRAAQIAFPAVALFAATGGVATAGVHEASGPRQPVAAVERTPDGRFDIAVSALAVTSFDAAKNELENRRLVRRLAEWGLWRELGAPTNRILSVSGLSPVSFEIADGRIEAEFSVPTNGVTLSEPPAGEPSRPIEASVVFEEMLGTNELPFAVNPDSFGDATDFAEPAVRSAGISDPTNFIAPLF